MPVTSFSLPPLPLTRRDLLIGGAGAAAGLLLPLARPRADQIAGHRRQRRAAADRDPEFRGGIAGRRRGRRRRRPGHHQQPQAQRTVRADRSGRLHRENHQHRRGAAIPELEDHQRPGPGHRPHDPPERRASEGRIPALGRRRRPAAHRAAIFHLAGILAADRAHHFRPDLRAPDRRKGLFRQPRGVRRRKRAGGTARQAAGADGSGRRQCSLSDARRRSGADAAVLAVDPGNHLYGVRPGRPARSICSTSRPASARSSAISPACRSRRGSRRTASASS